MWWTEFNTFENAWDPWIEVRNFQREMDRLFSGETVPFSQDFPAFNLWVSDDTAMMSAEMPGIDPQSLDISVAGDSVTLSGSREPETLKEGEVYHRQERAHGKFSRTFRIPFAIETTKVMATYERGVLKVELPRAESDKPRKIEIKAQ